MRKCPICGTQMPENAPYCPQCGTAPMQLQTTPLMTGNKGLDTLVGFAIAFGILFGSGVIAGLLAAYVASLVWLAALPLIGLLIAFFYAYRRYRFVAYGMLIPIITLLLLFLGILLLCRGFSGFIGE